MRRCVWLCDIQQTGCLHMQTNGLLYLLPTLTHEGGISKKI